jgi:hypothetical protein
LYLKNTWGWPRKKADNLIARLEAIALYEAEKNAKYSKTKAINRLRKHIDKAVAKGNWGSVAQLEGLLSRIEGTESAREVHVDISVGDTLAGILTGMTQESLMQLANEYDQAAQLAGEITKALPVGVVDAEYEEVKR